MARAQKVSYFAMQVPNRAGEAGRILAGLAKAGINLLAFTGFPSGRQSQMDFVPANAATFLAVARGMKLRLRDRKSGFLVRGKTCARLGPSRSPQSSGSGRSGA